MVQLRDGTIVCTSYAWARLQPEAIGKLKPPVMRHDNYVFLGGYLVRSRDGGRSWQGPLVPPACQGEANLDIFGNPVAAYNRGAMCEGRDGKLYWVVASNHTLRRDKLQFEPPASRERRWKPSPDPRARGRRR